MTIDLPPHIITPKDIIETLISGKSQAISLRPWNTRTQQVLFFVALSLLGIGALCAVLIRVFQLVDLRWCALISLALAQVVAVFYQLAAIYPAARMLGNPTKAISNPASEHFNDDVQSITELAQMFGQHHLDYARDRLFQIVEQLRYRTGFMIGAIDKVGILPSAVTGYFYTKELLEKPEFSSGWIVWVFVGIVAFYVMAAVFMTVSQRIEHLALIVKHAAAKKVRDV